MRLILSEIDLRHRHFSAHISYCTASPPSSCHTQPTLWHVPVLCMSAHSVVLTNMIDNSCLAAPLSYCSTDSDMGPMEEWNRHALISLQKQLKLNVIMNTGLINMLQKAAGGFMNQAEAQAVESKPNNAEQMGELTRILLGKRNADFKTFCTMLRQSNNDLWAEELERKAREFSGEPGMQVL